MLVDDGETQVIQVMEMAVERGRRDTGLFRDFAQA